MSHHTETVRISLHALKLKNVAGFGKGTSDPYAVVTLIASEPGQQPIVLGKTEVVKNNLSPHWVKTFDTEYEFGRPTRINISIFDEIKKAKNDKPMGTAIFELGEILGSRGNVKVKRLKDGGTVFCRIQKAPERHAGTFHFAIRGIKLKNVDGLFGKSDPFFELAKLVRSAGGGPSWQVVHRSEVKKNDLNPKWEPLSIGLNELCDGDRSQPILVVVKDWDKKGKHAIIGSFETNVNAIINAKMADGNGNPQTIDTTKAFQIQKKGKNNGSVCVTAASFEGAPTLQLSSTTPLANIPPALTNSIEMIPVPPQQTLIPPSSQRLEQPLPSTKPLSAGASASPQPIPFASATALEATTVATAYVAPDDSDNIGVSLHDVTIAPMLPPRRSRPKFVDYLSGGLELHMSVAIDFTGSNGDPRIPGTLHYIHPGGALNDYEKAITAVGEVVAKYDSDQKFPVLGFGAKYEGVVQHCFQVGATSEAEHVKGIVDAYRGTFKTGLVMSGPTVFAEVIQITAAQARKKQEMAKRAGRQAYHILLILTDGAVSDIETTRQAIQAASDAPLSIVIVGIGVADFSAMQFLDDCHEREGAGRDICQFVEFQKYAHNKLHLTQATLDEIPDQVVHYFYGNDIVPLPPLHECRTPLVDEYNEEEDIDLTLEFDDNGEIRVASGGMVDDTAYGNYDIFRGGNIPANVAYNPHRWPSSSRNQGQSNQSNGMQPQGGNGIQSSSYSNPMPPHPVHQPSSTTSGNSTAVRQANMFHVQLPPGCTSGQQIQIIHPKTGLPMIITVPPNVPSGGVFAIPYS